MSFAPGDVVHVLSLRKTGRVVEAARGGRYRVVVGAMVVMCRESELAAGEAPRPGRKAARQTRSEGEHGAREHAHGVRERDRGAHEQRSGARDHGRRANEHAGLPHPEVLSVDLHGMRPEEALDLVVRRLDEALRGGAYRIDFVHGRGSGRLKSHLHRYLSGVRAIRHFDLDPANPGVTQVFL